MVKFDTSALPSSAIISNAMLSLYVKDVSVFASLSSTLNVHQVTSAWTEPDVTWSNGTSSTWALAGGDYNSTVLTNRRYSTLFKGVWTTFSLPKTVVQEWVTTPSSNYGLLIKPVADGDPVANLTLRTNMAWFASSEDASVSNRPKLQITYSVASNVKPQVAIMTPDENSIVMPGSNVVITADATDPDGSVTNVEFLVDGVPVGSDSSAPFSATWQRVPAGTHALTAVAWDNAGAVWTSAVVTVSAAWTVYGADMNSNPGWTLDPGWAYGISSGVDGNYGYPDPRTGVGGSNAISYNLSGGYGVIATPVYATTPPLNCNSFSNTLLTFWYWVGVDQNIVDTALVSISSDGVTWHDIWANPATPLPGGVWRRMRINIAEYADGQPAVQVRWQMGPCAAAYPYSGWNIDNVTVTGDLPTYQITVTAGPKGTVAWDPVSSWYLSNETVTATATASNYYHFASWTGDLQPGQVGSNPVVMVMSQNRVITANFSENLATNGTPVWWLAYYGWTNNPDVWALTDSDGDGMESWQEYLAGTDPNVKGSCLDMKPAPASTNGGFNVAWQCVSGKTYQVMYTSSLFTNWLEDLPGSRITNTSGATQLLYTDPTGTGLTNRFYKVRVVVP